MTQPRQALFLGIEIHPSGIDLVVQDAQGDCVIAFCRAYARGEGADFDPQEIWRSARTGIKEMLRRSRIPTGAIRAIGISGCDDVPVLMNQEGEVLAPTLIGPRRELEPYAQALGDLLGMRNYMNLTGAVPSAASLPAALLCVRERRPRVWHDLGFLCQPRDFLRFRLTGTRITDPSTASASQLYNPRGGAWSRQLLARLGVDGDWLCGVQPGPMLGGRITPVAARESGLQAGTPVVTGGSHRACLAIAVGALRPGDCLIELGGNGGIFHVTDGQRRDPDCTFATVCHCLENRWALEAGEVGDGRALDWLMAQVLATEVQAARRNRQEPLDFLAELAAEIPPGADGLFFVPGSGTAGGGFMGLTDGHRRGHLVRAVLEGAVIATADLMGRLDLLHVPPERIFIAGPGASNTLWCQMVADALGRDVQSQGAPHAAARGCAVLAGVATGMFATIEEACGQVTTPVHTFHPRSSAQACYQTMLPPFRAYRRVLRGQEDQEVEANA